MSEPRRWKDSPDAPLGMRELLASARPTRALDDVGRRRGATRIARLGVAPAAAAAAVGIWTKLAAAGAIGLAAVGTVVSIGATRSAMPAPSGIATAPPPSHVVSPALAAAPVPDPEPTSTDATPTPTPTPTPVDEGAPAARSAGAVRTSAMPSPSPQVIASPPVETAAEPEATRSPAARETASPTCGPPPPSA